MAQIQELIHAGLPWTNPQKITIKSDQYVSDMTLNRGFLALLNNDYYLDLKCEAINKYLENNIDSHISDKDIHFSFSLIDQLITNLAGLTKSTIYRIPVYDKSNEDYTIGYIKNLIKSCPKNLGGYSLIFEFCIPASRMIGKQINNVTISGSNYTDYLKLSTTDTFSSIAENKISPFDYLTTNNIDNTGNNDISTLSLGSTSLLFDYFNTGNLILYGNTDYFIDDIANKNIFSDEVPAAEVNFVLEQLYTSLTKTTTANNTQNATR